MMRSARLCAALALGACADAVPPPAAPVASPAPAASSAADAAPSFDDDLAFLRAHGPVDVLESARGGAVAVSARWQARVMTSAVEPHGKSLGFVHRAFIASGKTGTPFDNFGGEDRFWLGPEGGQYGLYFPPGAPFAIGVWQTPHELQEGEWQVRARDRSSITFTRSMRVANWSRAEFDVSVERTVRVLSAEEVRDRFGDAPPAGTRWIAFESANRITNAGARAWTRETGLLSVWILGMYNPAPDARVLVPFETRAPGAIVNDAYFGAIPPERLAVHADAGWLSLVADGKQRGKIGVGAARARDVIGSIGEGGRLLTLVRYSKPTAAPSGYVNSMWARQADPYGGDVINAYNDGPTEPGKPSLGGFYELETSSPAAALSPGESIEHVHTTLHVAGDPATLGVLARSVLGVPIDLR